MLEEYTKKQLKKAVRQYMEDRKGSIATQISEFVYKSMNESLRKMDEDIHYRIFGDYSVEEWDAKYIEPNVKKYIDTYFSDPDTLITAINKVINESIK